MFTCDPCLSTSRCFSKASTLSRGQAGQDLMSARWTNRLYNRADLTKTSLELKESVTALWRTPLHWIKTKTFSDSSATTSTACFGQLRSQKKHNHQPQYSADLLSGPPASICALFAKQSPNEKPLERRLSALVGFISQDLQNTKPNQWQWWGVGYISLGLSSFLPTTLFWATGFFHPSIFEVLNHIESYKKVVKNKG